MNKTAVEAWNSRAWEWTLNLILKVIRVGKPLWVEDLLDDRGELGEVFNDSQKKVRNRNDDFSR